MALGARSRASPSAMHRNRATRDGPVAGYEVPSTSERSRSTTRVVSGSWHRAGKRADRDRGRVAGPDGVDRRAVLVEACVAGPVLDGQPDPDARRFCRRGGWRRCPWHQYLSPRCVVCDAPVADAGSTVHRPRRRWCHLGMTWGRPCTFLGKCPPQLGMAGQILWRTSGFRVALLTFVERRRRVVISRTNNDPPEAGESAARRDHRGNGGGRVRRRGGW